jgi:hypothetical protein
LRNWERLIHCVHPVNDGQELWTEEENRPLTSEKPFSRLHFGQEGCETGFRRGFSQLTFAREGGEYQTVRFPDSALASLPPGLGWA